MIVLVEVLDKRYASGVRVQTWNVPAVTREIYEYVQHNCKKAYKIWFGDNLYSNSEYSTPDANIQAFLSKYGFLKEDK